MKKKIDPKDLHVAPNLSEGAGNVRSTEDSDRIENLQGDKVREEDINDKAISDGTGSLCISEIVCMPTEKNCEMSQKECEALTKQEGCKETVDYCVSAACIDPSFNYCPISEVWACKETEECASKKPNEVCQITDAEGCVPTVEGVCVPTE